MRLTKRVVVDSFSPPFLRPKTFDKKEGIAARLVVIDLGEGRAVFSVWRITEGKKGGMSITRLPVWFDNLEGHPNEGQVTGGG